MTDMFSSSILDQIKEIATQIKEVMDDDNVTISYTVPMNQTHECTVNLKELEQEENGIILGHALTCKYNKLTSLLEEMKELLEKV